MGTYWQRGLNARYANYARYAMYPRHDDFLRPMIFDDRRAERGGNRIAIKLKREKGSDGIHG